MYNLSIKPLTFLGSTLDDLKAFPAAARRSAGYELSRVQDGHDPSDWKPMSSVWAGVYEIRIHEDGEFRVFYVAKRADAIYVLHAFRKKDPADAKSGYRAGQTATEIDRRVIDERRQAHYCIERQRL